MTVFNNVQLKHYYSCLTKLSFITQQPDLQETI